jgi:hypothetical protein
LPFAPNLLLSHFNKERNGFHIRFTERLICISYQDF